MEHSRGTVCFRDPKQRVFNTTHVEVQGNVCSNSMPYQIDFLNAKKKGRHNDLFFGASVSGTTANLSDDVLRPLCRGNRITNVEKQTLRWVAEHLALTEKAKDFIERQLNDGSLGDQKAFPDSRVSEK